jgi:hypothetical protein
LPVHPEHTPDDGSREQQDGDADQQWTPVLLQPVKLMLQTAQKMSFIDLKSLGGNFDAVTH